MMTKYAEAHADQRETRNAVQESVQDPIGRNSAPLHSGIGDSTVNRRHIKPGSFVLPHSFRWSTSVAGSHRCWTCSGHQAS
jgi:hypothetical protein